MNAPKMKMTTDIPPEITTPDRIETRLGTLQLFDGFSGSVRARRLVCNSALQAGEHADLGLMSSGR